MKKRATSKQRIVIFNWRDPWDPKSGGAEQVTLRHAQAWVKYGYSVTWVSGRSADYRCSQEEIREHISFFRAGRSETLFARAWWIYWQKYHGQFDIVVDQVHGLPMFSPLWAWKSHTLAFMLEVAQEIWSEMFPWPISWIGRLSERSLLPYIYRKTPFWTCCNSTRIDLERIGIEKTKITVIPNAITIWSVQKRKKEPQLTCIFLSRLVKMKGIEVALQIFNNIVALDPTARLWIVGWGELHYTQHLRKLVDQLSLHRHVRFYGTVSQAKKYELLARAHFLIHTSVREGFGLTVLEANSQRTPALVFDVAGLRDIVIHNQTGYICPNMDTTHFAQATLALYAQKQAYTTMSQHAYNYSRSFRWLDITAQSIALLRRL